MGKLTHTVSGNPVSFKSADKSNIDSCKIYFNPIQMGDGEPSSSNVKPIYGWNKINCFQINNIISINPVNFTPFELNGGTISYIDNAFIISGTITNNTIFSIPIKPFTLKKNNTYNKIIIIEAQGAYVGDTPSAGIGLKYNNDSHFSLILTPISQPVNVWNHSNTWSGENQEINNLSIVLRTGWSNIKIKLFITEESINQNTINFDSTIYGGYLDLITGTLVSDTIMFNLKGNEEYLTYQSNTHRLRIKDFSTIYGWANSNPISNVLKSKNDSDFTVYYALTSSNTLNLNLGFPSTYTEQQARDFIAQNNVQICCKLNNPIATYQLTPQQLRTFINQNNIISDANSNIECTYEFTDHMAKRRLELNTPHIETISGNIASFNTDLSAPLKECKINFYPAQDSQANPSPTNVKSISGWNGIQLVRNNFLPIDLKGFTTGQLGSSNGVINYLGNNTYEFIGSTEDFGSVIIPIEPITFLPNTSYHVMVIREPENGMNPADTALNIAFKTSTGGNIFVCRPNYIGWNNNICRAYVTFTESKEAASFGIGIPQGSSSFRFKFFLSANTFTTNSINWSTNYGTLYGGYIDLINGKLVQTHCKLVFDGTEELLSTFAAAGDQFIRVQFMNYNNPKIQPALKLAQQNPTSCKYSHGKYKMSNTIDVSKGGAASNADGTATIILLHLPIGLYTSGDVRADVHNYLVSQYNNGTPVELCYELATPIEYDLTPQQIKTLKGTNNIWSDANGNIEVKYWTH